ncbi:MAG: hypothetical protein ACTS46_01360 [Candidatus Hodgkinia cicadicola]
MTSNRWKWEGEEMILRINGKICFQRDVNPKGGGAAIGLKKIGNVSGSRGDRLLW